jgi:predicted ribosomally synthesized peptide with SipW-like signal peptide
VRAALAGGLVLGLGAGLTVASWSDAEYVTGTFTASAFDLQTNVQSGGWTTANPVTAVPVPLTGLYPGSPSYVSLKVKTTAGSTAGTVSLSAAANTTALAAVLQYRVVKTAIGCSATAFNGTQPYVVGSGAPAYQQVSLSLAPITGTALAANATSEVEFCIELGFPVGTAQSYASTSGTLTVNILGTST